jgi:hypothetical protein
LQPNVFGHCLVSRIRVGSWSIVFH